MGEVSLAAPSSDDCRGAEDYAERLTFR